MDYSKLAEQMAAYEAEWEDITDTKEFPREIKGINIRSKHPITNQGFAPHCEVGDFVAINPVKDEKTYLGILIGFVPHMTFVELSRNTGTLQITHGGDNPAIFVFDLKKVVLGCESWWGRIKSENHLRQITKDDIENVWYVKALKQLAEKKESDTQNTKS